MNETLGFCALCGAKRKLMQSHIVPKFVLKWLKNTSATGFMYSPENPNLRVQDAKRVALLCAKCENMFSKLEHYFAEHIFFPRHNEGIDKFAYDESLLRFVVSLSWRLLHVDLRYLMNKTPIISQHAEQVLKIWKNYLLENRDDPGSYEHHIFFLDLVESTTGVILPPGFQWYTLRAIDATLAYGENQAYVYMKLPGMVLVSCIYPPKLEGWLGTKIEKSGEITVPQEITSSWLGGLMVDRAKMGLKTEISEYKKKRILRSMARNREKALLSKSLEIFLAESRRERKGRKKEYPLLQELINIIEIGEINSMLPKETRALRQLQINVVANALASTDSNQAQRIEQDLKRAVLDARRTGQDKAVISDVGNLVVVFRTCLTFSKEQRQRWIAEKLEELENNPLLSKANVVLVIAWNPENKQHPSFEYGFQLR